MPSGRNWTTSPAAWEPCESLDDMTEMLSDAGQDQLALEWCQAGVDQAVEAGGDPEVEERRRALLLSRYYLREKLGVELDKEDLEARAEADASLAELTAMMRERPGPLRPGSDVHAARGEGAFDGIVLRWVREDFRAVRSRWPESTTRLWTTITRRTPGGFSGRPARTNSQARLGFA